MLETDRSCLLACLAFAMQVFSHRQIAVVVMMLPWGNDALVRVCTILQRSCTRDRLGDDPHLHFPVYEFPNYFARANSPMCKNELRL